VHGVWVICSFTTPSDFGSIIEPKEIIMRLLATIALSTTFFGFVFAAEKKIGMEDLPLPAQKAAKEQTKNAVLAGLNMETEKWPDLVRS
jgi:hypothetical protein